MLLNREMDLTHTSESGRSLISAKDSVKTVADRRIARQKHNIATLYVDIVIVAKKVDCCPVVALSAATKNEKIQLGKDTRLGDLMKAKVNYR